MTNKLHWHCFSTGDNKKKEENKAANGLSGAVDDGKEEKASSGSAKEKKADAKQSMLQKYGPVFLVHWTGLWAVSGVGVYVAMATMVTPEQVTTYMDTWGMGIPESYAGYGTIAAAVIVNEALEPLRFPLAVATTPFVEPALKPLVQPVVDWVSNRYKGTLASMEQTQTNLQEKLEKELAAQKAVKDKLEGGGPDDDDLAERLAKFEKEFEEKKEAEKKGGPLPPQ